MTTIWDPFRELGAVDLMVFQGQWPFRHQSQSNMTNLIEMCDKFGLSGMCVSHISSIFGFDTRSGNEVLLEDSLIDERLWPFVILNPDLQDWRQELTWAISKGARGVRLVPGFHKYQLGDTRSIELLNELIALQLPLQICVRLQDMRLQHPHFIVEDVQLHQLAAFIASAANRLPLLISGLNKPEWDALHVHLNDDLARTHLYGDLWFINGPLAVVSQMCKLGYGDQLTYSSCYPIHTAGATAMQLMAANISDAERSSLSSLNARRFLLTT